MGKKPSSASNGQAKTVDPVQPNGQAPIQDQWVRLDQLLDEQDYTGYWEQCMAILRQEHHAEMLSVRLFRSQSTGADVVLRLGETDPINVARIERWEESLRGKPLSDVQPLDDQGTELSLGRRNRDVPILHVRLFLDGVLRGGISLIFDADHTPTPEEYTQIAAMARSMVRHGLRAQQLRETQHRLEQLSLVYQVSQAITSSLNLQTVLKETTELAASVLGAQASTLFIVDHERRELTFSVPTGSAGGMLREKHIPINHGVAGWVATTGESLIVNDPQSDRRFASDIDKETGFTTENIVCVPLRIHDRIVGVLEVLNKSGEEGFTEEDKHWLETMGNQAAIALENARLYEDLRKEQERIIKAEEEVRTQLARDLHDGAAQMLSLIIMNVDVTRRLLDRKRLDTVRSELDLLEDLARQANREVRTLLFELRPIILRSRGLVPALRAYHEQLQGSMKSQVHLEVENLPFPISDQAAMNIFSIVQEAVNNIRKHAQAANVYIRLSVQDSYLHFEVEDDGRGFDKNSVEERYEERGSLGLLNMHERAEMLGGSLEILSPSPRLKQGTLVHGRAPLDQIRQTG